MRRARPEVISTPRPLTTYVATPPVRSTKCYTDSCLLNRLQPIRLCLHPFLAARDAMCLMQTSRSTTTALLSGYSILDHDHALSYGNRSSAEVKRSIALFAKFGMRILAMCLPRAWTEPLTDPVSGESVLPASLVALALGRWRNGPGESGEDRNTAMLCALFPKSHTDEHWVRQDHRTCDVNDKDEQGAKGFYQLIRQAGVRSQDESWTRYADIEGLYSQPIPPGALPPALRCLQLSQLFDQPLQRGSLPDTVEALHCGMMFNQPLDVGHLPASLTHLSIGNGFNQPLLPGVLPAGLKRLHLGCNHNHPLLPGVLPSRLEDLELGYRNNHPLPPGVIPSSLTHLRLGYSFRRHVQVGSFPEGVRFLDLGDGLFNQPLLPGVLPSTLRVLLLSRHFNEPLLPDSLPDGLHVLAFHPFSHWSHHLQPGVIPASVVAITLSVNYRQELVAGGVPGSVERLQLPVHYRTADLTSVLSPSTRVVWHKEENVVRR